MKSIIRVAVIIPLLCAGCTTVSQRRSSAALREQEIQVMKAEVYRLKEQVGGLSAAQDRLFGDLAALRAERQADGENLDGRLKELEASVERQGAQIEAARKAIVEELSGRMATIMKTQARRSDSGYGREHVVQSGETLSEISAAYGVTVNVLVRENKLKNANAIYAGQKLFIPE